MSKKPDSGSGTPSLGKPKNHQILTMQDMVDAVDRSTAPMRKIADAVNQSTAPMRKIADAVNQSTAPMRKIADAVNQNTAPMNAVFDVFSKSLDAARNSAGNLPPNLSLISKMADETAKQFNSKVQATTVSLKNSPAKSFAEQQAEAISRSVGLLKERHVRVKDQATLVDQRIQKFEEWVATIPGRVETELTLPDPAGDERVEILLRLERSGKKWTVEYSYIFNDDYDALTFKPLVEAGIRLKVGMLPQLPRLIESMVESQDQLSKDIDEATKEFDNFAALTMRLPNKEGH
jgi:hypothetical protein